MTIRILLVYGIPVRHAQAQGLARLGVKVFTVCCWRLGSLDWASWKPGRGVSQTLQKQLKMVYPIDACNPKLGYPIGPCGPKQGYPIGPSGIWILRASWSVLGAS